MSDLLIVGGGVVGLSLAWELSRRGAQVTLIDRGPTGREASWAGAGILPPPPRIGEHPWDQLRALSHDLHGAWSEELRAATGIDTGYRRCGGIYLARSAGDAAALNASIFEWRDQGIEVEVLDKAALVDCEPELRRAVDSDRVRVSLRLPDEAQLRNPRHLKALREACRQRQVRIIESCELTGWSFDHGRVHSVQTTQGSLIAGQYCVTSGAWSYRLLKQLEVPTGILPIRGQMVLFRCERPPFRQVINEGPRYIVSREDGHVLAGSTEEEVGFDKSTTESGQRELVRFANELSPALSDEQVESRWAGLRPASFDGFPYLGRLPGLDNAYVAAGHFRSGLHLSPGTAVVMSELIGGQPLPIDLHPFRPGRG